mmetsp:Transcript_45258/g.113930  ORF Transcript_45258/g.113930 Transcript_45258/m.113930 type:complete len:215 (-) Transcript_45258:561-1205(-)
MGRTGHEHLKKEVGELQGGDGRARMDHGPPCAPGMQLWRAYGSWTATLPACSWHAAVASQQGVAQSHRQGRFNYREGGRKVQGSARAGSRGGALQDLQQACVVAEPHAALVDERHLLHHLQVADGDLARPDEVVVARGVPVKALDQELHVDGASSQLHEVDVHGSPHRVLVVHHSFRLVDGYPAAFMLLSGVVLCLLDLVLHLLPHAHSSDSAR